MYNMNPDESKLKVQISITATHRGDGRRAAGGLNGFDGLVSDATAPEWIIGSWGG